MSGTKRYTIKDISEYLNIMRKFGYDKYIYRGQNEAYNGIEASGFRPYKGNSEIDRFYNLEKIKEEYYNRVISKLNSDEREHFVAFCQHHGLPTNLVDFTFSPLVALFFSCYGKEYPKFTLQDFMDVSRLNDIEAILSDKSVQEIMVQNLHNVMVKRNVNTKAEVYLVETGKLVDITDVVKNEHENFFAKLILDDEVQCQVRDKIVETFLKNKDKGCEAIINLIECYQYNQMDIYECLVDTYYKEDEEYDKEDQEYDEEDEEYDEEPILYLYKEKLKENYREALVDLYYYALNEIDDEEITYGDMYILSETQVEDMDDEEIEARVYLVLLINMLIISKCHKKSISLNIGMYFIYQPPDLFERIINQKGLFIYQPYFGDEEAVGNVKNINYQHILPDIIIEVDNHISILKELDYLDVGIDKIYGDLDSIARSIKYREN